MKPHPPLKLLVVEDDTDLGANVCDHFTARGHFVDVASDGKAGLHLAATENFDAILLDLMLPGLDGIELIRRLREEIGRATPILVISARDTVADRIAGLEAGADDYLVKPFALAEAEARVQALVRRARQAVAKSRLRIGNLVYDSVSLRAAWAGRPLDLAPIPLRILEMLMRAAPRVLRRGELERALWGATPTASDALRSHLYSLRSALEAAGAPVTLIETVRGTGWRLAVPIADGASPD